MRLRRGVRRLASFALSVVISSLSNLATIPLVIGAVGASGWAAIAAGQSIGAIAAVVLGLGWNVSGPAQIALLRSDESRKVAYAESLALRGLLLLPLLLVCWILSVLLLPPEYAIAGALAAIGSASLGLTAAWYFVGAVQPLRLMLCDTLPRAVFTVAAALATVAFPNPLVFGAGLLLAAVVPLFFSTRAILGRALFPQLRAIFQRPRSWFVNELRWQFPSMASSLIATSYKYLPLIVITAVLPAAAPTYALADRLLKFAISAVKPVSQVLQGWVPAAGVAGLQKRMKVGIGAAAIAAVVAAIGFIVLAPLAERYLGQGEIPLSTLIVCTIAATLALSIVSQTTGLAGLMAYQKTKLFAASAIVGALLCTALVWPGIAIAGAAGAAMAVAVAEAGVLIFQLSALLVIWSRQTSDTHGGESVDAR